MQRLPVDRFEWIKSTNFKKDLIKNYIISIVISDIYLKQTLTTMNNLGCCIASYIVYLKN